MIWWEDFKVGDTAELGRHTFTDAEIVAFARQFDPQPFHTDRAAAQNSVFGGLMDEIRWPKPVRAGDTLAYQRVVVESRASTTRKGVGLVKHRWEAVNPRGELVLTMEAWGLFGRKN